MPFNFLCVPCRIFLPSSVRAECRLNCVTFLHGNTKLSAAMVVAAAASSNAYGDKLIWRNEVRIRPRCWRSSETRKTFSLYFEDKMRKRRGIGYDRDRRKLFARFLIKMQIHRSKCNTFLPLLPPICFRSTRRDLFLFSLSLFFAPLTLSCRIDRLISFLQLWRGIDSEIVSY